MMVSAAVFLPLFGRLLPIPTCSWAATEVR
jgi:hypothetical protein